MRIIYTRQHQALIKALKEERVRRGLRQKDVAKRLKISQSWISEMERGQRQVDLVKFDQLAKAIGFDPMRVLRKIYRDMDNGPPRRTRKPAR